MHSSGGSFPSPLVLRPPYASLLSWGGLQVGSDNSLLPPGAARLLVLTIMQLLVLTVTVERAREGWELGKSEYKQACCSGMPPLLLGRCSPECSTILICKVLKKFTLIIFCQFSHHFMEDSISVLTQPCSLAFPVTEISFSAQPVYSEV